MKKRCRICWPPPSDDRPSQASIFSGAAYRALGRGQEAQAEMQISAGLDEAARAATARACPRSDQSKEGIKKVSQRRGSSSKAERHEVRNLAIVTGRGTGAILLRMPQSLTALHAQKVEGRADALETRLFFELQSAALRPEVVDTPSRSSSVNCKLSRSVWSWPR